MEARKGRADHLHALHVVDSKLKSMYAYTSVWSSGMVISEVLFLNVCVTTLTSLPLVHHPIDAPKRHKLSNWEKGEIAGIIKGLNAILIF